MKMKFFCNCFADDAIMYTIVNEISKLNENFQNNVDSSSNWYKENNLDLNVTKSFIMVAKSRCSNSTEYFEADETDFRDVPPLNM